MTNSDYVATLNGPILMTAPHTTELTREDGSTRSVESDLTDILPILAAEINTLMGANSASYMYWATPRTSTSADLDGGNLLNDAEQDASAFHKALHKFAYNNFDKPLLHLDLHGK